MLSGDNKKSLGCPSKMYLCGQIGVMNSILEMTMIERYTMISESCTDFRVTSCVLRLCLPKDVGEERSGNADIRGW
jgi:hypothetical protein